MTRIVPPSINRGDLVAVVAPGGPVDKDELESGLAILEKRYRVDVSEDILRTDGYLAGGDERRLQELQRAIDDPDVRAVVAARGGFGTSRILHHLKLETLLESPKWIVGSSDLTVVLMHLWAKHGVVSVHGPMVASLGRIPATDVEALQNLLEGDDRVSNGSFKTLLPGRAQGPFIGGNLTMLAHLMGVVSPLVAQGAILFLEDVGERPYRLDRYLTQLRLAGFLGGLAGVVLGDFTNCDPGSDGMTALEAVERNLSPLSIPVAAGFPAAHGLRNFPFLHGAEVRLEAKREGATIDFYRP